MGRWYCIHTAFALHAVLVCSSGLLLLPALAPAQENTNCSTCALMNPRTHAAAALWSAGTAYNRWGASLRAGARRCRQGRRQGSRRHGQCSGKGCIWGKAAHRGRGKHSMRDGVVHRTHRAQRMGRAPRRGVRTSGWCPRRKCPASSHQGPPTAQPTGIGGEGMNE